MADDLEDRSPGAQYEIFVDNEQLMERLKLLDFETKFVAKGLRPISRVTFAIQNKYVSDLSFVSFLKIFKKEKIKANSSPNSRVSSSSC